VQRRWAELIATITVEVDVILVEGYKHDDIPKIVVNSDGIRELGVGVAAVSADGLDDALRTVERLRLGFTLLSDPQGRLLRAYQHWDERAGIGEAGTFIIRPDRSVVFYEDDAERFYRRPRTARLLEVARTL
jgi:peroxiredoxin